ncbi:hypothetical protein L7F22_046672 [Adiantum nelumboides]|nr:hypothetical protein [Adiantum nelumboides]
MVMQRLLTNPNFDNEVEDFNVSQVVALQAPSPHFVIPCSPNQFHCSPNFAASFQTASPMFFHMQATSSFWPITPPTMAILGSQPPPRAPVEGSKKMSKKRRPQAFKASQDDAQDNQLQDGGPNNGVLDSSVANTRAPNAKKSRGAKKKKDTMIVDDDYEGQIKRSPVWKDYWVVSLIHERGGMNGMNDDFNKLQKQGNDVNKTCKWFDVVDEYMHDRAHIRIYSHASATIDAPLTDESAPEEENLHPQPTMQKPYGLPGSKTMKAN